MTPYQFIAKWRASELKERSAAQEYFIDLCRPLNEPTPAEADPTGEHYCFERGARKDTGGDGWADVWKRHHFAWEHKGKRPTLDDLFKSLLHKLMSGEIRVEEWVNSQTPDEYTKPQVRVERGGNVQCV